MPAAADQRVILHGVTWAGFEAQLGLRGDVAGPRIAYLDGVMELMSPSRDHERIKSYIGCLIEAFALERGLELSPYGSWTLRDQPQASGLEPDECYIIGLDQSPERPHLAIEVTWTHGGIDKHEIYRRLGVPELWHWEDGKLDVYELHAGQYHRIEESKQLPGIDLKVLVSLLDEPTVTRAVRAFRAAMQR